MGRHHHSLRGPGPDGDDWEEPPPPAPLWRTRVVTSAVLLLAVVAGTWWAVGWLTSPAGPGGAGAPVAAPVQGEPSGSSDATPVTEASMQAAAADRNGGSPSAPDAGPTGSAEAVTVHVAGEVREPGLVVLPAGSRVDDALQAAGGPTGDAQLDLLNIAAPVVDGRQILVPGPGDPAAAAPASGRAPAAGAPPGGPGGAGPMGGDSATVNVNTADAAALEQLPGIGPALASRIMEHRDQVGPFGSMEDLDAVSGIGPAMMERLDGLVTW